MDGIFRLQGLEEEEGNREFEFEFTLCENMLFMRRNEFWILMEFSLEKGGRKIEKGNGACV